MRTGDTFTLELPEITRGMLALYAGASGDHNPVHIDLDECHKVGIDDVFAHGMLSMAFLGRLLTEIAPQHRLRSWKVRFTSITPVHATPICTATVTGVENGLVELDIGVGLADGTPTLLGTAHIAVEDTTQDTTEKN